MSYFRTRNQEISIKIRPTEASSDILFNRSEDFYKEITSFLMQKYPEQFKTFLQEKVGIDFFTKKILFNEIGKSRSFTIFARSVKFKKIYKSYSEAIDFNIPKNKREEDGKKIALFNKAEHLELAVYKSNPLTIGGAGSLFGLRRFKN